MKNRKYTRGHIWESEFMSNPNFDRNLKRLEINATHESINKKTMYFLPKIQFLAK